MLRYHTSHEVAHVAHDVRVFVDVYRVLVELVSAPQLRQLAAGYGDFVVDVVAHHHDIGSLGKVVKALSLRRLVQTMAQTVEELVVDGAFKLETQLAVGKSRLPLVGTAVVLRLHRAGEVDVDIEGVVTFFESRSV